MTDFATNTDSSAVKEAIGIVSSGEINFGNAPGGTNPVEHYKNVERIAIEVTNSVPAGRAAQNPLGTKTENGVVTDRIQFPEDVVTRDPRVVAADIVHEIYHESTIIDDIADTTTDAAAEHIGGMSTGQRNTLRLIVEEAVIMETVDRLAADNPGKIASRPLTPENLERVINTYNGIYSEQGAAGLTDSQIEKIIEFLLKNNIVASAAGEIIGQTPERIIQVSSGGDIEFPGFDLDGRDGNSGDGGPTGHGGNSSSGGNGTTGTSSSDNDNGNIGGGSGSSGSGSDRSASGGSGSGSGSGGGLDRSERPGDRPDRGEPSDGRGGFSPGDQHPDGTPSRHDQPSDPDRTGLIAPLVVDLDADGVEISTRNNARFDWDEDGYLEKGSWAAADDGFLVVDFAADGSLTGTGDGKVTQTKELVLTKILERTDITDLQALTLMEQSARYGGNNDGVLNSRDGLWQQLKIWQDSDQDGKVDAGEMKTLAQHGIKELRLRYDDGSSFGTKTDDISVLGNTLKGVASYVKTDGTTVKGGLGDMSLSYETRGFRRVDTALGYEIQFEAGAKLAVAELAGKASANLNLDEEALDGAIGDDRANSLSANGHSRAVQIDGGKGDDSIGGGEGDDSLMGGEGADQIIARGGNDVIFLDAADLAANKTIDAGYGIDTAFVTGSAGVSLKLIDHGFEAAHGGAGNDRLDGTGLSDDLPISGGGGDDTIIGGDGDDNLAGDAGHDRLFGGIGDDRLFGGSGNDSLSGGSGSDILSGGTGNDTLDGQTGDNLSMGGDGADSLIGGGDDDRLDGGTGNDTLNGGSGDDVLIGGSGNDRLSFWSGDDTLMGDTGNDTFIMEQGDIAGGFWGWTVVQGGKGEDTLVLTDKKSDWDIDKVSGNQWQLYRRKSDGEIMVIDAQDIEKVRFADGSTLTLSTNVNLDTSDDYTRRSHDPYSGDSRPTLPSDNFTSDDGAFNGYMGNDRLDAVESVNRIYGPSSSGGRDIEVRPANDFIRGMSGRDTILAAGGNDKVYGNSGADALRGEDGDDLLQGGSGADLIWGGDGNDTIFGNAGGDMISGGSGNDSLDGGDGSDEIDGGAGNDTLIGGVGADRLYGDGGNDVLKGGTGADKLYGEDGDDRLEGEAGSDILGGGKGNDTLVGGDGFNIMSGDEGDDSLVGGNDDDLMAGGADKDVLKGGIGHDTLIGGSGADTLDGGAGIRDMVSYEGSNAAVVVRLEDTSGGATEQTAKGGHAAGDVLSGFEQVLGSDHGDYIVGSSIDNVLMGGKGDDFLAGGDGNDDLIGGAGDDTINGGVGDDRIWGDTGNDTILASWGRDTVYGGSGSDTYSFATSASSVSIDLASNKHTGFAAETQLYQIENITAGSGDDTLRGTIYANILDGGDGNDLLIATSGAGDRLIGGAGADTVSYQNATVGVEADLLAPSNNEAVAAGDTYSSIEGLTGSAHDDILRGTDGGNTIRGELGDDRIAGRAGNDRLLGGEGSDVLFGNEGNDTLYGEDGNDQIFGEDGDDFLRGGTGNDSLFGGEGADTFYFGTGSDRDIIADFKNNVDKIHVDFAGITDFAKAKSFAKQSGDDVVFDFGGDDVIIIRSVTIGLLENDMIFG